MERCIGLDQLRRLRDRADGQGNGSEVCGREEDHDGVPGDQLMSAESDRNANEAAAAPPRSAKGAQTSGVVADSAAAPILSVNNIEVVYDHVILVLKGVSLEVPKGEIVALLGANGAGKSTTLKAIS